jgi:excisionase family DNA binding protein
VKAGREKRVLDSLAPARNSQEHGLRSEDAIMQELLRVDQVAEILNIRPSAVRSWILGRRIPTVKLGAGAIRVPASAVKELIERGTRSVRRR